MNLNIGQKINIPGLEITNGIKSLWEQNRFSDIQVHEITRNGKEVILEIYLESTPRLSKFRFSGIKKSEEDALREELKLKIGTPISPHIINTSNNKITDYFISKGFRNITCQTNTINDSITDGLILHFDIQKNTRIKIAKIKFNGNNNIKSSKLKKLMKNAATLYRLMK